ncbi:metal-dependent phosphohydrolase [Methanocella sp. CWC-04]|uniref:Metal-dependent phosphohydrolase n=1 Tax=Methanooceanicella nereidis TaxID=2052831 RepID=A0AAP2RC13_9EURY|nr:HD domain-containing protein [Methanocella sp. CWC-04]MCD1294708.1 metal-dependent phosphohydrolase [Methanocella sp. CWC-04]
MNKEDAIKKARDYAESLHRGFAPSHDFSHVERVYRLAERIATEEGADLFIVRMAALLHDIGRAEEKRANCREEDIHDELSVKLSKPFLDDLGLDDMTKDAIIHAIATHRHRRGGSPQTLEARCLFDADKLDSLGAVGIARSYLWLGEHGRSVYYPDEEWIHIDPKNNSPEIDSTQREWHIKLRHLKDKMYTDTGKAIAVERHERMARIIEEIEKEVKGII